jgi:uncharacterized protein
MRLITLEEHYRAPMVKESLVAGGYDEPLDLSVESAAGRRVVAKLDDIGEARLADMDGAGIDVQVLSHTVPGTELFPPEQAVSLAQAANDYVSKAIARNQHRFAAFATLPTAAPRAAADELERAVTDLGFKGALINGHTQGRCLDDPSFWPMFERAQRLEVPIYLHPTDPPAAVRSAYYSGLAAATAEELATAGWGWHVDTGLHALRLVIGGVFDEFPGLQIIIGHMGEALPFMLTRSSRNLRAVGGLRKPLEDYLAENFYITTSGMFTFPPLLCLMLVLGSDRVMFSVDYPYSDNEDGTEFLRHAPISAADKEKIAHGNAETLLHLEPSTS